MQIPKLKADTSKLNFALYECSIKTPSTSNLSNLKTVLENPNSGQKLGRAGLPVVSGRIITALSWKMAGRPQKQKSQRDWFCTLHVFLFLLFKYSVLSGCKRRNIEAVARDLVGLNSMETCIECSDRWLLDTDFLQHYFPRIIITAFTFCLNFTLSKPAISFMSDDCALDRSKVLVVDALVGITWKCVT